MVTNSNNKEKTMARQSFKTTDLLADLLEQQGLEAGDVSNLLRSMGIAPGMMDELIQRKKDERKDFDEWLEETSEDHGGIEGEPKERFSGSLQEKTKRDPKDVSKGTKLNDLF